MLIRPWHAFGDSLHEPANAGPAVDGDELARLEMRADPEMTLGMTNHAIAQAHVAILELSAYLGHPLVEAPE